jgi:hypothetical protein
LAPSEVGANSLDQPHTETKGWEKAQNLSMLVVELLQEKLNSNLSDGQEQLFFLLFLSFLKY